MSDANNNNNDNDTLKVTSPLLTNGAENQFRGVTEFDNNNSISNKKRIGSPYSDQQQDQEQKEEEEEQGAQYDDEEEEQEGNDNHNKKSKNQTASSSKKASWSSPDSWRNMVAFFICGLLNNYGYVLIGSAAENLLPKFAGVILLCEIIPSLIVKLTAPLYFHLIPYNLRVIAFVLMQSASFLIIAFVNNKYLMLSGIVLGAISCGGGEVTFLQMSSFYHKNTVSTWSSGTGGAGIFGAFTYLALHAWIGLSPKHIMLISTILPFLMIFSAFILMTGHHAENGFCSAGSGKKLVLEDDEDVEKNGEKSTRTSSNNQITVRERLQLLLPLTVKYMLPLAIVYFMEYLINFGIAQNINFKTGLITSNNWVYYSNVYQIGVFISRSSVNFFPIRRLWIPAVLQTLNVVILFLDAYFRFIPAIWFIFIIIFWEGLLGGGIYVNTYYRMSIDIEPKYREYSISVVSNADSFGISLAGLLATFLESWLHKHQSHRYI